MVDQSCDGGAVVRGARFRRRRFLAGLGSGGLAVAGAMFGRVGTAAAAGGCACCNLIHCPANITFTSCTTGSHYVWTCQATPSVACECCEAPSVLDGRGSAYSCRPH